MWLRNESEAGMESVDEGQTASLISISGRFMERAFVEEFG